MCVVSVFLWGGSPILYLSQNYYGSQFLKGNAVNDYIDKNEYLGEVSQLVFPKVGDFVDLIRSKGRRSLLYKKELKRAYRQISIDPKDYNLVSFVWKNTFFVILY